MPRGIYNRKAQEAQAVMSHEGRIPPAPVVRETRADHVRQERKQRSAGNIDMGAQLKMDVPEARNDPGNMYRWEDAGAAVEALVFHGEYNFVTKSILEGLRKGDYLHDQPGAAEGEMIKRTVGQRDGQPHVQYLVRIPRWIWEENYESDVSRRMTRFKRKIKSGEPMDGGKTLGDKGYAYSGNSAGGN